MPGSAIYNDPIAALPFEILSKIAYDVAERHYTFDYVVDPRTLAALARVSKTLRPVAQELLFKEVLITSERQLHALVRSPLELLANVRELNIFMDVEFYDVWRTWAFTRPFQSARSETYHPSLLDQSPRPQRRFQSPYSVLAYILCHTPNIRTLRMRIAESAGPRSAWHKFALSRAFGIPFGQALEDAFEFDRILSPFSPDAQSMSDDRKITLPFLTTIALDGFVDIEPLLALTPNLATLHLFITSGFPQNASKEFIGVLGRTVGLTLKEFVFTPDSLRVEGGPGNVADMILGVAQQEQFDQDIALNGADTPGATANDDDASSMDLVDAIGDALPNLEILDLRSYWHGEEVHFLPYLETITIKDLYRSLHRLPNLRSLALPTSIMTEKDLLTLRLPIRSPDHGELVNILIARQRSIESAEKLESLALQATGSDRESRQMKGARPLSSIVAHLREISFVRPLSASHMTDSCVTYELSAVSTPSSSETSHHLVVRSESCSRASASPTSGISAWPHVPPLSLTYTLSRIWSSTSPGLRNELALAYIQDHQPLVLLLAGAGGAVIGQAGIRLRFDVRETIEGLKLGEKLLVAVMMAGSTFYAASRILNTRLPARR